MSEIASFPGTAAGSDLIFPQNFSLRMPPGLTGRVTVRVDALSDTGAVLESAAAGPVEFAPDKVSAVSVCFGPCPADASVSVDGSVDASASDAGRVDGSTDSGVDSAIADARLFDGSADSAVDATATDIRPIDGAVLDARPSDAAPPDACSGAGCFICPQPGWCVLPQSLIPGRSFHSAVWTGSEMVVWAGQQGSQFLNDGYRWSPVTQTWTPIPQGGSPSPRVHSSSVWDGSKMFVFGGFGGDPNQPTFLLDGYRWNANPAGWSQITQGNIPTIGFRNAVWADSEMIVWELTQLTPSGYRWNPTTNVWTLLGQPGGLIGRVGESAVWASGRSEMFVWGGAGGSNGSAASMNDVAKWNRSNNQWTHVSTSNPPSVRAYHSAVWTGAEMIVWGGYGYVNGEIDDNPVNSGKRWNPTSNQWNALPLVNAPTPRAGHSAVWTGSEMIIWGGSGTASQFNDGFVWRP